MKRFFIGLFLVTMMLAGSAFAGTKIDCILDGTYEESTGIFHTNIPTFNGDGSTIMIDVNKGRIVTSDIYEYISE